MTPRFEKPAQIKRPLAFHMKIGAAFGVMSTMFLYFSVLSFIPNFPVSKYFSFKFARILSISSTKASAWLDQLEATFHTTAIFIACAVVGCVLSIVFTVISRRSQNRLAIGSGGQINSRDAAKKLGAME